LPSAAGYFAWLNVYSTRESLGAASPYDKIEAEVVKAFTLDRYTVLATSGTAPTRR